MHSHAFSDLRKSKIQWLGSQRRRVSGNFPKLRENSSRFQLFMNWIGNMLESFLVNLLENRELDA